MIEQEAHEVNLPWTDISNLLLDIDYNEYLSYHTVTDTCFIQVTRFRWDPLEQGRLMLTRQLAENVWPGQSEDRHSASVTAKNSSETPYNEAAR
jgi:hypothetical protein